MGGAEAFANAETFGEAMQRFQRDYLLAALRALGGSMELASAKVGVNRHSFRKYLVDCGVDVAAERRLIRADGDAERAAERARLADVKRRTVLRKTGKPLDTPRRVAKAPRKPRIVPVLKAQGMRLSAVGASRPVLAPRVPVRRDELGWAEAD